MSRLAWVGQRLLLVLAGVALLAVLGGIFLAWSAAAPSSQPARVVAVVAGPYALTVRLYKDPGQAGLAIPFAIVADPATPGPLRFTVESVPGEETDATAIGAPVSPDPATPGGVQGAAEIPVRGAWSLHIAVTGPAGAGTADVPITATAPPPIPGWLGWALGLIPLAALIAFLLGQRAPPPSSPPPGA